MPVGANVLNRLNNEGALRMCPFLCSVHLSVYRYVGFGRYTLVLYFHELFCLLLFLVQLYEHSYSLRSTVNRSRNDNPLSLPPFCSLLRCLPTHSSHDRLNWPPKSSRRPSLPPFVVHGMSKQWLACLLGPPSLPPFARPNVDLSLKPLLSPFVGVFLPSLIVCLSPFWSFFFPAARRSSFSPSKPISLPPSPSLVLFDGLAWREGRQAFPTSVRPSVTHPSSSEVGRPVGRLRWQHSKFPHYHLFRPSSSSLFPHQAYLCVGGKRREDGG